VRRVWRQLEQDYRRNALRTTRVHSSGPAAFRALKKIWWHASGEIELPRLPPPRRGRPVDTIRAVERASRDAGLRAIGENVLFLLEARAEARRRGFTRRNPAAFAKAVAGIIANQVPRAGMEIGRLRDANFTPIVLTPREAATFVMRNYSALADELRTPRAVRRRFRLDHRTTKQRRDRRTPQMHT
jgi:hypothetical protein